MSTSFQASSFDHPESLLKFCFVSSPWLCLDDYVRCSSSPLKCGECCRYARFREYSKTLNPKTLNPKQTMSGQVLAPTHRGFKSLCLGRPAWEAGRSLRLQLPIWYILRPSRVPTCMPACMHACMHACIHTYIHIHSQGGEAIE